LIDLGLLPATNVGPLIAAVTCGICLGFLPDNFHPARIFMGDAGALMLGLLMSASTMVIGGRTPPASGVTFFFFAPLLIPVFILGVPLMDSVMAFIRRTASGQGFSTADKNHIHHRLMRLSTPGSTQDYVAPSIRPRSTLNPNRSADGRERVLGPHWGGSISDHA